MERVQSYEDRYDRYSRCELIAATSTGIAYRDLSVGLRDDRLQHGHPAIVHACHPVHPVTRGADERSEGLDLRIQSGRTSDAIRSDGWRMTSGDPEESDEAEARLQQNVEV